MKNKKEQLHNEQIERLFDSYAQSLPAEPQLAEKARQALFSESSGNTLSRLSRPKSRVVGWVATIAACLAVLITFGIVTLSIFGSRSNNTASQQTVINVYDAQDVEVFATGEAAAELLQSLQHLKEIYNFSDYQKCRAYRFKSDKSFAYICAEFGIVTDFGVVELSLIAENGNYVEKERKNIYKSAIENSSSPYIVSSYDEQGEYVTNGYFASDGYNFYINAKSNQSNVDSAKEIVRSLY